MIQLNRTRSFYFDQIDRNIIVILLVILSGVFVGIGYFDLFRLPLVLVSVGILGIFFLMCIRSLEAGFYAFICIGFCLASVDRMTHRRFPVASMALVIPYLLICIVLIRSLTKSKFRWAKMHPLLAIYLFSSFFSIVQLFNPEMQSYVGWVADFWQRLSYVFLFFISYFIFDSVKSVRIFIKFSFALLFFTAVYGCYQQWFGLSSFDANWVYSDPRIHGLFSLPGQGLRKFSTLSDPANFGTLMAGSAVGTLVLMVNMPFSFRHKAMLSLFAITMILGMSYSGTRTASIMLVAGIGLYIVATLHQKRSRLIAIFAVLAFAFIIYAPIYGNVTINRFRSAFAAPTKDASYDVRMIHREMMQPYLRKNIFGGGVNTAGGPGLKYNPNHILAGFPPDSGYFAIALNLGPVGLAIECILQFFVLFYCFHYYYRSRNREIRSYYIAIGTMIFTLYLGSYAQFTFTSIPQSFLYVPFMALIIKMRAIEGSAECL